MLKKVYSIQKDLTHFNHNGSIDTQVIKLFGHKIYWKLRVDESQYKKREKISTEKLIISTFNSIIQFNFISFNSLKSSRKIPIEKFIMQVRNLQNIDFLYLLSKLLQQFQNSKFSRASPKSYFRNQFVIIVNDIMYRKLTFYLRNFMVLVSFLFYLSKAFIFVQLYPFQKMQ